jgi:orotate phosphoribosyltransferase
VVTPELDAENFLRLAGGRSGHFRLESGYHGGLWLDLDDLFAERDGAEPFVAALETALRPFDVDAVCGPLLGGAFLAQLLARSLEVEFWYTERSISGQTDGLYSATYRLPAALARRGPGKRCAIVDDVMSAGSALRATCLELESHGATPAVAGALLVLGSAGWDYFAGRGIPVVSPARREYELWLPADCPFCARGEPLEDTANRS